MWKEWRTTVSHRSLDIFVHRECAVEEDRRNAGKKSQHNSLAIKSERTGVNLKRRRRRKRIIIIRRSFNSSRSTSTWPFEAAVWMCLQPSSSALFILAPCFNSSRTTPTWTLTAAVSRCVESSSSSFSTAHLKCIKSERPVMSHSTDYRQNFKSRKNFLQDRRAYIFNGMSK